MKVLVHIVVYRSYDYLDGCLSALRESIGDLALSVEVTANGPVPSGEFSSLCARHDATLYQNVLNLGFCGAHNQAAKRFLDGECEYLMILNPDLALEKNAIQKMISGFKSYPRAAMACPLLLRADENLHPLEPPIVDSAGMVFTESLRHFDRFAGKEFGEVNLHSQEVAGGSGACLLFSRNGVESLVLNESDFQSAKDLFKVFPQLESDRGDRVELFDEAFFAYREDAELSLRARAFQKSCFFVADAIGYHVRRVTPERRAGLSVEINRHSVRNRFLLQMLYWSPWKQPETILPGFIVRNLLVLLAVCTIERSSFRGIVELFYLRHRAWKRRRQILRNNRHEL